MTTPDASGAPNERGASPDEAPVGIAPDGTAPKGTAPDGTAPDANADPTAMNARTQAWVGSTYFAEGFPYSVVHSFAEVLFKDRGASLSEIGLTSLFHLPWNLKFLWGPYIDEYGTKRGWILFLEVIICMVLAVFAVLVGGANPLMAASILFLVLAVVSATHDMAIDGFYLEGLNKTQQTAYVGYRAAAYRIAMLVVGGPLLVVAGKFGWTAAFVVTATIMVAILAFHYFMLPRVEVARRPMADVTKGFLRPRTWGVLAVIVGAGYGIGRWFSSAAWAGLQARCISAVPALAKISTASWIALLLFAGLFTLLLALPWAKRRLEADSEGFYGRAFIDFLDQPKVGLVLTFIVLFRAGESFLTKMRYPFLSDMGITTEQYGWAYGTLGVVAGFVATVVGGWLIAKHGIRRWVWPMVLGQNCLNLLFMVLAWVAMQTDPAAAAMVGGETAAAGTVDMAMAVLGNTAAAPEAIHATASLPLWMMQLVIGTEAFGAGLGTAIFMIYIIRCCRSAHKAAHMAILTALMSLSFTIAGVTSGFLAEGLGYFWYFGFTFIATIPGMVLLFFVPYLDGSSADDATA